MTTEIAYCAVSSSSALSPQKSLLPINAETKLVMGERETQQQVGVRVVNVIILKLLLLEEKAEVILWFTHTHHRHTCPSLLSLARLVFSSILSSSSSSSCGLSSGLFLSCAHAQMHKRRFNLVSSLTLSLSRVSSISSLSLSLFFPCSSC